VTLDSQEALFEIGQKGEVVWREDYCLHDGKIDLHLNEPVGVNRGVHTRQNHPADLPNRFMRGRRFSARDAVSNPSRLSGHNAHKPRARTDLTFSVPHILKIATSLPIRTERRLMPKRHRQSLRYIYPVAETQQGAFVA